MRVAILTVSDSATAGTRKDESGPGVRRRCVELGWEVVSSQVVPDERSKIQWQLLDWADSAGVDLALTTGGTGLGPRDITPEATTGICDRLVPGLAERMRQQGSTNDARAALSRAVAGVRGRTLIVNLPGSPQGAVQSLEAIADLLPHAVEVLHGARHD